MNRLNFVKTTKVITDPFAKNLLDWNDETRTIQPKLPSPEHDLSKQPRSDNKVKQDRENKNGYLYK